MRSKNKESNNVFLEHGMYVLWWTLNVVRYQKGELPSLPVIFASIKLISLRSKGSVAALVLKGHLTEKGAEYSHRIYIASSGRGRRRMNRKAKIQSPSDSNLRICTNSASWAWWLQCSDRDRSLGVGKCHWEGLGRQWWLQWDSTPDQMYRTPAGDKKYPLPPEKQK